jgi:hypothetical protein
MSFHLQFAGLSMAFLESRMHVKGQSLFFDSWLVVVPSRMMSSARENVWEANDLNV